MPIELRIPITTAVIEESPRCVARSEFRGEVKTGAGIIHLDACRQDHHAVLGLDKRTKLHWSGDVRTYEIQELSSFPWSLRYQVTTRDAWYERPDGTRVHYTPTIQGIDAQRGRDQEAPRVEVQPGDRVISQGHVRVDVIRVELYGGVQRLHGALILADRHQRRTEQVAALRIGLSAVRLPREPQGFIGITAIQGVVHRLADRLDGTPHYCPPAAATGFSVIARLRGVSPTVTISSCGVKPPA